MFPIYISHVMYQKLRGLQKHVPPKINKGLHRL